MVLLLTVTVLSAQGIAFEPEGTLLYEAAMKAKKENKMVFVDCFTQWCGPCKKIAPIMDEIEAEYEGKVIICKCDVGEDGDEIAAQYRVRNVPTILFFKDGAQVDKHVGTADKEQLKAKIDALL